jgi:hypothetical protein
MKEHATKRYDKFPMMTVKLIVSPDGDSSEKEILEFKGFLSA